MSTRKKLGILGGMGSQASAWLFNRVVQLCGQRQDQEYVEILLHNNTAIPDRTRAIVHGDFSPLPELQRSVRLLGNGGAQVMMMACMTAYHYYPDLTRLFAGEFINPLDLIAAELLAAHPPRGAARVGVIGSTGLLESGIVHAKLRPLGYQVVTLDAAEQEEYFMKPIYMPGGIKSGAPTEAVKQLFRHQAVLLQAKGAGVIVGACSEVPLVMQDYGALPFLNAFDLLARRAVLCCDHST